MNTGIVGFAGQSNMVGYRSDPSYIVQSSLDSKIPYSTYNTSTTDIGNSIGEYGDLRPMLKNDGGGNGWTDAITVDSGYSSWGYGPEISCCRSLYSDSTPIAAVKYAIGGQSLDIAFNPSPAGYAYTGLRNYMQGLEATLKGEGHTTFWKAFVWWQGEADAEDEQKAEDYYDNLTRLVEHVRAIARNPSLPIVIVKTVTPAGAPYLATVQNAQEQVCNDFNGVELYDPSGLPLYSDNVHFCMDAMITAGNAIASIIESYY